MTESGWLDTCSLSVRRTNEIADGGRGNEQGDNRCGLCRETTVILSLVLGLAFWGVFIGYWVLKILWTWLKWRVLFPEVGAIQDRMYAERLQMWIDRGVDPKTARRLARNQ